MLRKNPESADLGFLYISLIAKDEAIQCSQFLSLRGTKQSRVLSSFYSCEGRNLNFRAQFLYFFFRTFVTKSTKSSSFSFVRFGFCYRLVFENFKLGYIRNFCENCIDRIEKLSKKRSKMRQRNEEATEIKTKQIDRFIYSSSHVPVAISSSRSHHHIPWVCQMYRWRDDRGWWWRSDCCDWLRR